jgi:hypothetical protein
MSKYLATLSAEIPGLQVLTLGSRYFAPAEPAILRRRKEWCKSIDLQIVLFKNPDAKQQKGSKTLNIRPWWTTSKASPDICQIWLFGDHRRSITRDAAVLAVPTDQMILLLNRVAEDVAAGSLDNEIMCRPAAKKPAQPNSRQTRAPAAKGADSGSHATPDRASRGVD